MNEDVKKLLKALRDSKLDWIADEIENTIQSGKTIIKEMSGIDGRKTKKATMTIQLSDAEQLDLCLRTIKAYFIDLYDIWAKAKINFAHSDKLSHALNLNLQISDPESKEHVELFEPAYENEREKLQNLIDEASKS